MKKINIVQLVCIGGVLTSITVLFQSAPVFFPTIGLAISPFSTLPVAIAAVVNVFLGLSVFISSAFILFIVSPQEAIILLFTTGILGITLGSLLYRKGILVTLLASAASLVLGIILLTYVVAIPSFVEVTGSFSFPFMLLIFSVFSLIYVSIWYKSLKKLTKLIMRLKLIEKS